MSASGRSSPMDDESDTETDTGCGNAATGVGDAGDSAWGDTDVEPDAQCPETPRTADILTDEPFQRYQYRLDDFGPQEMDWIEKVKIFKPLDEGDSVQTEMNEPIANVNHQISVAPLNQTANYASLPPTDAFGRVCFNGKDIGGHPAWFIRMAAISPQDVIQSILEKLEVMNNKSQPLRIHCIDYNRWPEDVELPSMKPQPSPTAKDDEDWITVKLQKDLWSICEKTEGIVLTWSGLGGANLVHQALGGIAVDSQHSNIFATNLAAIATPPWNGIDPEVQLRLKVNVKGTTVRLDEACASSFSTSTPCKARASSEEDETKLTSTKQHEPLGEQISAYASHYLMLDEDPCTAEESRSPDWLSNLRHFHCKMIEAMETYEKQKQSSEMPVVCILFNGHHDALKMVVFALEKKIPVLIVKGSGGYADIIADVYLHAQVESTKERDETGQVYTRNTKKPGPWGDGYLKDNNSKHPLLKKIFEQLDYLTVYIPANSVQTLESAVFEALLKHKQEAKFGGLVEIMQQSKKILKSQHQPTETGSLLDSETLQMDFFIEALMQNSVDVVKVFLDQIQIPKKFMHHLHMGRVLRLYTKDPGKAEKLIDFRRELKRLLKKLPMFPLRCLCDDCPNCNVDTNTKSKENELKVQRTCLHPIQELFLWTLYNRRLEMAIVFWERCDDKIAAALVAQKVFASMAKQSSDPDVKLQIEQNVKRFQALAIQTLKNCHDMDEIQTELLLTKPCPWWGDVSVLQLAIMTSNREFMTQTACKNVMTRIWKGEPAICLQSDPERKYKRPCQLVDFNRDPSCCGRFTCSPRVKYFVNFMWQVVFLLLFSFGLLSDLDHGLTTIFIILIVWVAAVTLEELTQLWAGDPVIINCGSAVRGRQTFKQKCHSYWSQYWNRMDVATILLFGFGMFVFIPVPAMHVIGRFLLSIDVFLFFMRTFQMLMVFDELGLMLVMVYKMIKDTFNFMIILLIFVVAYAVGSESLLYPESDMTWPRLFHLPRKAYWQVFGELILEEIELRENDECTSGNSSKHYGYDTPHCPTEYGSYIVPVLLGLHVMVTNVLLLNLLIARFGVTFNKVHDQAREHQAWHRCQIITEFYSHTLLPAPLNILLGACQFVLGKIKRCCRHTCCQGQRDRHQTAKGAGLELQNMGDAARGNAGRDDAGAGGNAGLDQRIPLIHRVTVRWSADRRNMDVFWDNRMPAGMCLESSRTEVYTVKISVNRDLGQPSPEPVPKTFEVARKPSPDGSIKAKQALAVWDLDPSCNYTVRVDSTDATQDDAKSSRSKEVLLKILNFESNEGCWVCRQDEGEDPIVKDLKQRTEILKTEMGQITDEMKTNYDSVKKDISKIGDEVTSNSKTLEKVSGQSDKNRKNIRKIDSNLDRLSKFVESDFKSIREEAEDIKKRALKADIQKDQAEKKREDAEKKRARAEAEKEKALEDGKLADGALKKAWDERDACKMEAESAWAQVRELTQALEKQKELQATFQQQLQITVQQQLQTFKEEQQQHIQSLIMQQQQQLQQRLTAQDQQLQTMQQQQQQQIQSVLSQISLVAKAVCPPSHDISGDVCK